MWCQESVILMKANLTWKYILTYSVKDQVTAIYKITSPSYQHCFKDGNNQMVDTVGVSRNTFKIIEKSTVLRIPETGLSDSKS